MTKTATIKKPTTKSNCVRLASSRADYDLLEIEEALEGIENSGWTTEEIDASEMEGTDEEGEYEAAWDRLQSACNLMEFVCCGSEIEALARAILFNQRYAFGALQVKTGKHVHVMAW